MDACREEQFIALFTDSAWTEYEATKLPALAGICSTLSDFSVPRLLRAEHLIDELRSASHTASDLAVSLFSEYPVTIYK